MADKDHTLEIKERWFDLSEMKFSGKVTASEVMSIVAGRPVRIQLTVIVPAKLVEGKPPKFDIDKCAPVRRLWQSMVQQVVDTMSAVAEARRADSSGDADAYAEADKQLKALNGYMKKSFQQMRPLIREGVAKALGGSAKAEDLQTVGSVDFKEYEIKPGAFANEIEVEPQALDLTKAFKNRKWQECGLVWNGKDGVISVKRRKEFKATELKDLREHLPKNKSVGASMLACRFMAESSSTVVLEISPKDTPPAGRVVIRAIKKQSSRVVKVSYVIGQDDEEDDEYEDEEGEEATTAMKTKGTSKKRTKKKGGKKKGTKKKGKKSK